MSPLLAGIVLPQFLVAPESVAALARELSGPSQQPRLECSITPMPARLGFSMMHWSGFGLAVPVKQFAGKQADVGVVIELAPKDGKPAYMAERFRVPAAQPGEPIPKGAEVQYLGGYYLGPGEYRIRMLVRSVDGRGCRKDWKVGVKAGREPLVIEPNNVVAVGSQRWKGLSKAEPARRVTVFLDASPLFPRRNMVRLSSYDRSSLLTSLTTMLDLGGFTHAAVVAADSRNRKLVFSSVDFDALELRRLGRALGEINLGVVSMQTLQGPGPAEFFESVLDSMDQSVRKSEAVVFLGPAWSWQGKLTPRLREIGSSYPDMHYLALTRFPVDDNLPSRFVKAGGGSAKQVFTPEDLAKALQKIRPADGVGGR